MIVVDACVLIGLLNGSDAHHQRATVLLAATADEPLRVSALTMAEVLVGPTRTGSVDKTQRMLDQIGFQAVDLSAGQAPALALLRATTGLKVPDCCVLLTAETHSATLATFDERLTRAAAARGVPVLC